MAVVNRNVNVIAEDFELPSVWKANLAFDHELPFWGVVSTVELLLTDVENALFYRTLNIGAGSSSSAPSWATSSSSPTTASSAPA